MQLMTIVSWARVRAAGYKTLNYQEVRPTSAELSTIDNACDPAQAAHGTPWLCCMHANWHCLMGTMR